ncbi:MAG: hypothetical protein WC956_01560 [bacterium]
MQNVSQCSRSSALPPDPDVANFELAGVGSVLKNFETKYDSFDVDPLSLGNRHNESNASSSCCASALCWFKEGFGTDTTIISGYQVGENGYKLAINVNSEASTLMWNKDVVTYFKYDPAEKTWSMSAKIYENGKFKEYKYCDPVSVFDTLVANLRCYIGSEKNAEATTLEVLLASLSGQKEGIVKTIKESGQLYPASDCEKPATPDDIPPSWLSTPSF